MSGLTPERREAEWRQGHREAMARAEAAEAKLAAVRAICDRLEAAEAGWRGVVNMAARYVPCVGAGELRAALDGTP
jgi:hypothetical protein